MKKKRKQKVELNIDKELKRVKQIRLAEERAGIITDGEAKKPIRKLVPKLDIEHLDIRKVDESDGYIELKVPVEKKEIAQESKQKDHICSHHCEHHIKHHTGAIEQEIRKLPKFYLYAAFIIAILNLVVQLLEEVIPILFFYISLSLILIWFSLNLVLFFYFLAKRYEKEYTLFAAYYVLKFIFFIVVLNNLEVSQEVGMAIIIFTSLFESLFAFVLLKNKRN